MGTTIYMDSSTGASVLSVDDSTVASSTVQTIELRASQTTSAPASEADLRSAQMSPSVVNAGTVDGSTSVQAVLADPSLQYTSVALADDGSVLNSEPVDVVILPDSWTNVALIDKWTRLCYEQQKATYSIYPFWYSFDLQGETGNEFTSQTVSAGYSASTIDFPILPFSTEVFSTISYGDEYHKIDCKSTNHMIEDIQVIYRQQNPMSTTGYDIWRTWEKMDSEDDPILFQAQGQFQFSSYPLIDSKQVPMSPLYIPIEGEGVFTEDILQKTIADFMGETPYETIYQTRERGESLSLIPKFNGNVLMMYYFIPAQTHVHKMVFKIEDEERATITTLNLDGDEGWVSLGTLSSRLLRKPIIISVERYHLTKYTGGISEGQSFIDSFEILAHAGMVRADNYFIEAVNEPMDIDGPGGIPLRLRGDIANLYKPDTIEKAFQPNLEQGSNWYNSVRERRSVLRLMVSKVSKGSELELGNFILNPVAPSGDEIQTLCNLDQNLEFIGVGSDEDGAYMDFRYLPYAGPKGLLNSSEPDTHYYLFRVAEWTLGVEHGLITDQSLAFMISSEDPSTADLPPYRYDAWDEEHPVRRHLYMSPVNPRDDSVSRCASESRGAGMKKIVANPATNSYTEPASTYNVEIPDDWGWHVLYSDVLLSNGSAHLTYPYFSFRVKLPQYFALNFRRAVVSADIHMMFPKMENVEGVSGVENDFPVAMGQPDWSLAKIQRLPLATFDEYSDVYDVRDFVSWLWCYNWFYSQLPETSVYPSSVGEGTEEVPAVAVQSFTEQTIVPDPSVTITEEQYLQYSRFLKSLSKSVADQTKQKMYIKYYITIFGDFMLPGSGNLINMIEIPLTSAEHGLWDTEPRDLGKFVGFNFEEIEQPEDNVAYVSAGARAMTDLSDQFTVAGESDDGDSGSPGVCGWTGTILNLDFPTNETTDSGDGADTISGDGSSDSYVSVQGEGY